MKLYEPKILLDSDVIRHFIYGEELSRLTSIFPDRFVILDRVETEICRSPHLYTIVVNFISMFKVPIIEFPQNKEIIKEYSKLIKTMGTGESACLAVAKHTKDYIASSNITEIKGYCQENEIVCYTTMDLLVEALNKGILSEEECDNFIRKVHINKSKLPCSLISDYIKMKGGAT